MLPPSLMVTIKNQGGGGLAWRDERQWVTPIGLLCVCALLALLAGCTPAGPRALLEGKRLIDNGHYPQAIQKLKTASTLLGGTNALAWEYLGLAYQHSGAVAEAEWAYARALALDRDLSEVRFNLGCLWLAQNKLDAAKAEFTAYTLRRPTAPEGFLKLGTAQLRGREPSAAEKSFNEALRLNPQSPEAMNGLGLAKLQRGRSAEAAQCFESALKQQPGYPPALLNLAIVSHQYLRDRQLALQKYREYLALKPAPANADALAATVQQLEQELNPPARRTVTNAMAQAGPATGSPKSPATNVTRKATAPKAEAAATTPKPAATNPPKVEPLAGPSKPVATNAPKASTTIAAAQPKRVEPPTPAAEPVPKRPQQTSTAAPASPALPTESPVATSSSSATGAPPKFAKSGFFERINPLNLFRGSDKTPMRTMPLDAKARSPQNEPTKTGTAEAELPVTSFPALAPQSSPGRYTYKSPPPPSPGNQEEAERSFQQGVRAHQAHRLPEAIKAYLAATQADPSLFEAHYNLGLVATEAGNLALALISYENALAARPTSLDARYNFALVLKQSNYPVDAANELERVLVQYPNETRAHLALGNLYAQQFGQPDKARQHYLKVLEVEPQHPQASAIGFWLKDHPL
jgi:tetratricopeptide (TPR) repeat protein